LKKVLNGVDTAIRVIEDTVSLATLAAIVCITTAGVIGRYVFQTGFLWADEVNQALLVAMGMFGSARAVRFNGHTEFTSLANKPKSKKVRILIRGAIAVITLFFVVVMLIISAQYTADGTMRSVVLRVPRMYYYMSIPLGFALCVYEYLRAFKRKVMSDPSPENN